MRLSDCRWVEEHQDLIVTGSRGCGKSFIVSMLGQQACIQGLPVWYCSAAKLFEQIPGAGLDSLERSKAHPEGRDEEAER